MRPPTQSGASDISVGENNASGVGGEVGPDAVGPKQLRRGDFFVPVNLTCNSRPERATKAAKCGNRTCKAAAESAASQNGSEPRSAVGRALGSQLTCPPLLIKTNCDDFTFQDFCKLVQSGCTILLNKK